MIDGIRLKVCGLTTQADADDAVSQGADFVAFNVYPKSPRFVALEKARTLARATKGVGKVIVTVEPTVAELAAMADAGFDFFQIHFRADFAPSTIAGWAATVGPKRLWLAPKLPPEISVTDTLLPLAETFLLDTFDPNKFGGSGKTGDWSKFSRHQQVHPTKTWILSGGLNPGNVGEALRQSGARFVDVNSGVESAPGVKDHAKLAAFVKALRK